MRRLANNETRQREVILAIQQLIDGRNNAASTVTLTANVASTTITKSTINANASFLAFPKTANAAGEMAAGTMYAVVSAGQVVITHANNAQADREFYYVILGG